MKRADPIPVTADETTEELVEGAEGLWQTFLGMLPRFGVALGLLVVGYLLSRLLRSGLGRWFRFRGESRSFATVMSKLAGWVLLFAVALASTAVAFPSVQPVDLLAGLGFFSLAVGFAFQDILENTLSGVLLLFRQPFASGDQVEVHGQTGTVEAITIRETRLRTFDGQLVVIPNRDVYKNVIRVQTHYDDRRVSFVVGIAYENDPREACEVIRDALAAVSGVAADPPPDAIVVGLGVSTVDIEAGFWAQPSQRTARLVLDEAIKAVKEALESHDIEMPADIVALQATPSFRAALQGDADVTPGGGVRLLATDDGV